MNFIKTIYNAVADFFAAFWAELNRNNDHCVATAVFTTTYVDKGKPTGVVDTHVLKFMVDGYRRRYCLSSSTCDKTMKEHGGVLTSKEDWKVHGNLPDHAERTKQKEVVPFAVVKGDKSG